MRNRSRFLSSFGALLVAATLTTNVAFGGVIDFNMLTGANGESFSTYTESGFTVASTTGAWFKGFDLGNPVPSIFVGVGAIGRGSITVTNGGGLFAFDSVDVGFGRSGESFRYTIEGALSGSPVFTQSGTAAGPPAFSTITGASSAAIDALVISITASPTATTSLNVDNIVYSPASSSVPEPRPPGLSVAAGSLLACCLLMRNRRRAAKATNGCV